MTMATPVVTTTTTVDTAVVHVIRVVRTTATWTSATVESPTAASGLYAITVSAAPEACGLHLERRTRFWWRTPPTALEPRALIQATQRASLLYERREAAWRVRTRCRRCSPRATYFARVRRMVHARAKGHA